VSRQQMGIYHQAAPGFHRLKATFGCSSDRADPIAGQVLEFGACRYVIVGITYRGVIDVAAMTCELLIPRLIYA